MRKIWNRRDKEKRKSFSTPSNQSPLTQNNSTFDNSNPNNNNIISQINYDSNQSFYTIDDDISSISEESPNYSSTSLDKIPTRSSIGGYRNTQHSNGSNSNINHNGQNTTNNNNHSSNGNHSSYIPTRGSSISNQISKFHSLVKPDYDNIVIKNSWVNIINNGEINEQNLRLYRAELKGSHLYLYKPSPNLNIKNFKFSSEIEEHEEDQKEKERDNNLSDLTTLVPSLTNATTTTLTTTTTTNSDIDQITYFSTKFPHPQLAYDFDLQQFQTKLFQSDQNTLESIIHFIMFSQNQDQTLTTLINIIPILPEFNKILKFISSYISAIFDKKFKEEINETIIIERIILILNNIEENFNGFLLKSDIAPYILKIIEILQIKNNKIQIFKQKMLKRQQLLINLINNNVTANPFKELNSQIFMKDINLIEFSKIISEIDLKFFKNWNSNIDKSLLLSLSIRSDENNNFYKKNPLIYNNNYHIHYLSRLLINHLFLENNTSNSSNHNLMENKAKIIEKWIDLGCLLDKSGNMSSWLGISSIILSQPVLRLNKIWSLVSPEYIKLLKNDWSPVLFELDRRYLVNESKSSTDPNSADSSKDSYHIMAPRGLGKIYPKEKVIPYFGDLIINNHENNDIYEIESIWKRINYSFDRWNDYLLNLSNYQSIINYNVEVLKRYDSMGFIFSNESLNHVLQFGQDNKDLNPIQDNILEISTSSNINIKNQLLKLIELNCESIDLEKIMKLSIILEPDLPENYLKEITKCNSIPHFNNNYFKINIEKYDNQEEYNEKYNFIIDDELTFRIDDYVEIDHHQNKNNNNRNDKNGFHSDDYVAIDDEDDIGLGIDVDDILNSEKFNNLTLSPKSRKSSNNDHQKKIWYYIPKFITIERSIDLLLIDSKNFDNDIQLDLTEYRFVFLLNYNTFMTTKDLLDKLAHRFINSGNAVLSVMKRNYLNKNKSGSIEEANFPNWNLDSSIDLNELGEIDYELLLKIQINILKVLIVLINNFYSNFSLNLSNKTTLIKLLKLFSNEILQWYNSNKINSNLEKLFENLVSYYKKLKKLFVKKSYRPIEISKFNEYLLNEFKFTNSLNEVPMNRNLPSHKNIHKIEKFLYKFNKLLTIFYKGIKSEDWIEIYKIMENLYDKNLLFEFNLQSVNTNDDALIISNIFNYFETLLVDRQLILKKFPLVFRKLFKLYFRFKTYLSIQLIDNNITIEERLDRMKTLLIMCKISKLKMNDNQFIFEGTNEESNIPSCIETAIINVIYSPESRKFSSLWIKSSNSLDHNNFNLKNFNNINDLIPSNINTNDLQNFEPLLPCFGWIIENLIELNKIPSFHIPTTNNNKQLINFNKRYLIFKFIKELGIEDIDDVEYNDSKEFEFLLKLNELIIKNSYYNNDRNHNNPIIFKEVLKDQHNILVIDNQKKSAIDSNNQKISSTNNNNINNSSNLSTLPITNQMHTITKKPSNSSLKRQSLSYKSNSSSRFKISGLFTKSRYSLNNNNSERSINVKELPNPDSQIDLSNNTTTNSTSSTTPITKIKPSIIIPLRNKKIFPVYLFPFSFKIEKSDDLDTSNNENSILIQTLSDQDLNDWLILINFSNRHWFQSRLLNFKINNTPVVNLTFGLPLNYLCSRDFVKSPKFLDLIYKEIEKSENLKEIGIYRISSSILELQNLKISIDKFGTLSPENYDIHTLTSIIKTFFRDLPDSLIPDDIIIKLFELKQEIQKEKEKELKEKEEKEKENEDNEHDDKEDNEDKQSTEMYKIKIIINQLPNYNYYTLKKLINHLILINSNSQYNKMNSSNLSTVLGPCLVEASNLDLLIQNFGFMNTYLEKFILNFDYLFND
ncbi:BEM2 [Candida pseudojiufengensis]|uniref:BEM2 n=1 Tax=Candida pseudojiufengensis TaxID=497109 RepID=UPI0022254CE7|nr:BEM2 [Candida pseudojiufengensis]KAI5959855.1 BEM2 [Candida pseudojiufengensis]